ncbi:MAG: UDPGP type 1 family protein [Lachnospiraceae bacterium]|nr:UDPGP type 1 family protein [Lachnospiraceae bacterium]
MDKRQKAIKKLEDYNQLQLLKFEDSLDDDAKEKLYNQIEALDFSLTAEIEKRKEGVKKGVITPLKAMEISDIEAEKEELYKVGIDAIKAGKVGAVLLAGGMGTRLGSDNPKGMYNIGVTKELYIFECLINNLMDVVNEAGSYIPLFVMTSDLNYESTTDFFKEKKNFGYPDEYIFFFKQEMAPACDYDGKILLEEPGKIAVSPNGNGGWFLSMKKSGVLNDVKRFGIEWLNIFAVDNVCQRICDPLFVGATILKNVSIGSKVVRKADPYEKVGVMCLEDGKPSIVEYYELTEDMAHEVDERGERVYNFGVILNYLFRLDELEEIVDKSLPYHVVEKKIPYVDEHGKTVKPESPNGCKFEQLVLDMIHLADSCLPYEVVRDREFAPVKNKTGVDSVEPGSVLLKKNGVEI